MEPIKTPQETDLKDLVALLLAKPGDGRVMLAIAGPPGSGKSTLAEDLIGELNISRAGQAALLPMDGYHYDDTLLSALGRKDRKGAPDTFDVGGLQHILMRLRNNQEDEVAVPVFDRDIEIARAGARLIGKDCRIVVVEGNYLLLGQPPWNSLAAYFDMTVMIKTETGTLRDRLTRRWQELGLSGAEIDRKVNETDLPNGVFVYENSAPADFSIKT